MTKPARKTARKRNPPRRRKLSSSEARAVFDRAAAALPMRYRDYWINFNAMRNEYFISRDGAHISYASSVSDAKAKIDELLGPRSNPKKRTVRVRNPTRAVKLKAESALRLARAALSGAYLAKRGKDSRVLQAKISYAQGVTEALYKVGAIGAATARTYISGLRDLLK